MGGKKQKTICLGQIGMGHWGPNLFRNFYEHPDVSVMMVCDVNSDKKQKVLYYNIPFTDNPEDILKNSAINAVVISTPLSTHYELAQKALLAGKHVFVEKPLASSTKEALELKYIANKNQLTLMVGHVFLFNPGIQYIKSLITSGAIGKILAIQTRRTNLGPIRQDTNALWDLASHDISILNYWLEDTPVEVTASGSRALGNSLEDIVSANFYYPEGICCNIFCSWLHPQKVRQITVVGDEKMVVWDDLAQRYPVRIYNKSIKKGDGVEQTQGTFSEFHSVIHEGDILLPNINTYEPLRAECSHFIDCLLNHTPPMTDADAGLDVIIALDAATASIKDRSSLKKIYSRNDIHGK
jgi:predicted dehydrogenase